jgi:serine/threonine-protein kinase
LKPGDQVRDYILEQRIGAGGVGEVWRARHIRLNKPVAIKLILPHLCEDENIYSRFVQEAIATANLEHPHIISVHDFFSVGDDAFLVMSFIEGGSLQDRIKKRGRLSLAETLHIARGILDALDFAHQKGIVHRDVKPSNLLLSPDLHAYLVDFGIALVLGKTRITRFGANIGTPDYMSPEQIRGEQLDHRTDVYSFGCVLYEMLTGRSPFRRSDDDTEFTLMERHMNETPASMRSLESAVNEETEAVIMRAMAKNRDQRFAGCADMARALIAAAEVSVGGPSRSPDKTARVIKAAAAVLALTTLVSAGGWIAANGENERLRSANPPLKEIGPDHSAVEKAANEIEELKAQLAAAGQTARTAAGKLENELQAASAAREKAEREAQDLKKQLVAGDRSDKTTVAKLQNELQDARTAHERAVRELRQMRERLAVKEREPQPAKKSVQIPAKATREITRHLILAKQQRERGAYDAALSELNAAKALDPANEEIADELDRTRRACNAEKRLGRTDLKC